MRTENANIETNENIVAAAFACLEPGKYSTMEEVEVAVAMKALKIKLIVESEQSLPNRLLGAVKIKAEVKRVEFEESSKRYKIYFVASNNEDGEEEMIRTDRTDGRIYMNRDYIESLPGKSVIIFKTNEKSEDKKMSSGYRVAPYVKIVA